MRSNDRRRTAIGVAAGSLLVLAWVAGIAGSSWPSERGLYRVSYESTLSPIVINRMHGWILHVESADGKPLDGASIEVSGGMPAHRHGLPTRPRVVAELGDGAYRVEGLRFHMPGAWEIVVTIEAGNAVDRVVIPLKL